ncbi:hypothetical protein ACTXT7_003591 [Hymenolepis weldensis]
MSETPGNGLGVSLNSRKFYYLRDGEVRLKDVGIVSGDLIYVKSDIVEEDIKSFRSAEAWQSISDSQRNLSIPLSSLSFGVALFPLDVCARNSRENVNVIFPYPQDLLVVLSDKLVEPVLVDIHQVFVNQRWICEILDLRDLGRLAATCRRMNRFINTSEVLWRRIIKKLLPIPPNMQNSETIESVINEHGKCPSLIVFKNLYRVRTSSQV